MSNARDTKKKLNKNRMKCTTKAKTNSKRCGRDNENNYKCANKQMSAQITA